ncbi:MAG: S-ribosylhomocysteine lyase [Spirochaetales bacterium]|nr:S-ribosylhomocysteine lyase [Spirochaetales bacterium]
MTENPNVEQEQGVIASFTIDHDHLNPGVYLSRVAPQSLNNGTVYTLTWDYRVVKPNTNNFMSPTEAHTLEHLMATELRTSPGYKTKAEDLVYVGPMGCATGFYIITQVSAASPLSPEAETQLFDQAQQDVAHDLKLALERFQSYSSIPGSTAKECGNYRLHNLDGALKQAKLFLKDSATWEYVYPTTQS